MSQRKFKFGPYDILTGWDRPLQYHFLTVQDRTNKDEDAHVYCNLDDRSLPNGAMTSEQVMAKLKELGINTPLTLKRDLDYDRETNAGNIIHTYSGTVHNPRS
jgi:hypothetical protein